MSFISASARSSSSIPSKGSEDFDPFVFVFFGVDAAVTSWSAALGAAAAAVDLFFFLDFFFLDAGLVGSGAVEASESDCDASPSWPALSCGQSMNCEVRTAANRLAADGG